MAINSSLASKADVSGITIVTRVITAVAMPTKNTEYPYTFPAGTKRYKIQGRGEGVIKLAFVEGESGTNYWTIFPGSQYEDFNLNDAGSFNIYVQSPMDLQSLEIIRCS